MGIEDILSMQEIADLLNEFEKLNKRNPKPGSEEFRRLIRVGDILGGITLKADQIPELQKWIYSLMSDDHIKRSGAYTELKKEYDKLELRYGRLEERYRALVRQIEEKFGREFELKGFMEKQREEINRER